MSGVSAREQNKIDKRVAEAGERDIAIHHTEMVGRHGKSRRSKATPATARQLALETRALAKVLPQEARVVAKELRADAKHLTSMQEKRKRQAPPARVIPAPPPTAVVARAAAKNPVPVSMADIKKFFGVTIPKPAVAALTPEQFFGGAGGGAKAAAAEVPFSSSSSSGGAKAAAPASSILARIKSIQATKSGEPKEILGFIHDKTKKLLDGIAKKGVRFTGAGGRDNIYALLDKIHGETNYLGMRDNEREAEDLYQEIVKAFHVAEKKADPSA